MARDDDEARGTRTGASARAPRRARLVAAVVLTFLASPAPAGEHPATDCSSVSCGQIDYPGFYGGRWLDCRKPQPDAGLAVGWHQIVALTTDEVLVFDKPARAPGPDYPADLRIRDENTAGIQGSFIPGFWDEVVGSAGDSLPGCNVAPPGGCAGESACLDCPVRCPQTGHVYDQRVIFDHWSGHFIIATIYNQLSPVSGEKKLLLLAALPDGGDPHRDWKKLALDPALFGGCGGPEPIMLGSTRDFLFVGVVGDGAEILYTLRKCRLLGDCPDGRAGYATGDDAACTPLEGALGDTPAMGPAHGSTPDVQYMISVSPDRAGCGPGEWRRLRVFAADASRFPPTISWTDVEVAPWRSASPIEPTPSAGGVTFFNQSDGQMIHNVSITDGSLWTAHETAGLAGAPDAEVRRARWYRVDLRGWPRSGLTPVAGAQGELPTRGPAREGLPEHERLVYTFEPSIAADDSGRALLVYNRAAARETIALASSVLTSGGGGSAMAPVRHRCSTTVRTGWPGDFSEASPDPAVPGRFWGHGMLFVSCDGSVEPAPSPPGRARDYRTWIFYRDTAGDRVRLFRLDWNADEVVDPLDFQIFLADHAAGHADYNADGRTDSADFLLYTDDFLRQR